MHLRSITMRGFKSFPDRTRLEFAEGVSVIVGPNGSGKSNVTDAVLWALGEQSPLAVRGQTMQDVIFSGGPGVPSRSFAEVEVVIDDSELELGTGFSELSIMRRLDRSGEGEYRLNGARCRLVDVLEALSDTGLGKEMHSVVSQGRVEAVIHSSPHDRRLLVEEAAGLGKHRKRRRRAELKLRRTEENLSRALDVEREARTRLRPLKRQAEAADLHARLERQALELRHELALEAAGMAAERLTAAERQAAGARGRRSEVERRLKDVLERREAAEQAFAAHSRAREVLSSRLFAATTAIDRVEMRLERVGEIGAAAEEERRRLGARLRRAGEDEPAAAGDQGAAGAHGSPPGERIARLEAELAALDAAQGEGPDRELARLRAEREDQERRRAALEEEVAARRLALRAADSDLGSALDERRQAEAALAAARADSGRARAELEALSELGRRVAPVAGAGSLAERIRVDPGYELAVAAALGPLLRALTAGSLREATSLLDEGGVEEATVLIARPSAGRGQAGAKVASDPPAPGAERLLEHVRCGSPEREVVARILGDAWLVESLGEVAPDFRGVAVTRAGRALAPAGGELRQVAAGGDERLLERLSRRDELEAEAARYDRRLEQADEGYRAAARAVSAAEEARDRRAEALRQAVSELSAADEAARGAVLAVARREQDADQDQAVRRAEIAAELRAERRIAERLERRQAERRRQSEQLRARRERHLLLEQSAGKAVQALEAAGAALAAHRERLHGVLQADEAVGASTGEELRACAHQEARLQAELRDAAEVVTEAEVSAQQARDAAAEAERELSSIEQQLGVGPPERRARPGLSEERRAELAAGLEQLARRRERLGPVNPLAEEEYEEARRRLDDLERQRGDLERALAELRGVISETDRRIRESFERTFEATARNFEEVVEELFPGGRGRLRLVMPEAPRAVIGGEETDSRAAAPASTGTGDRDPAEEREPGIEVEVTPAGKSTRRLGLMSGGERALVALAFLFAVFLARPSPFYVLDEVEAALDDLNIDRFLRLVRRCARRAQFIVVTHQKRTMDAGDCLYGVSMGGDGVSKVVSRRLPREPREVEPVVVDRSPAAA